MVDSLAQPQECRQKACGGSGAAHMLAGLRKGDRAPCPFDRDCPGSFVHSRLESQILDAFQEMPGVVGEEDAPQGGSPLSQRGQQQGTVGDALGAGDAYCQRPGEPGCFGG